MGGFAFVIFGQPPIVAGPGNATFHDPAFGVDEKAAFLDEYAGGHLCLDTAPGQVLVEAATEAAIDEYQVHLIE